MLVKELIEILEEYDECLEVEAACRSNPRSISL